MGSEKCGQGSVGDGEEVMQVLGQACQLRHVWQCIKDSRCGSKAFTMRRYLVALDNRKITIRALYDRLTMIVSYTNSVLTLHTILPL